MRIPLNINVTQGATDLLASSFSSTLIDRAEHCNIIGHCRTVWNIIWSCLITIFACIWVAVHPNIPAPKPPFTPARFEGPHPRKVSWAWVRFQAWRLRRFLTDLFRRQLPNTLGGLGEKLAVALLALLAPEFIFVWALRQWLKARSIAEECREAATQDSAIEGRRRRRVADKELGLAEQRAELEYLNNLGGSRRTSAQDRRRETLTGWLKVSEQKSVEAPTESLPLLEKSIPEVARDETNWKTTHGFFILMGGFHQFEEDQPLVYLLPSDVVYLVSRGVLTPPSEEDIRDRSKSDAFSKLIVLMQTVWFVMQAIARHIEHLPITELEIATLAYTVPILGIYICWWNKPLGVRQPIRIPKSIWDGDITEPQGFWDGFIDSLTGFQHDTSNRPRVPRFSAGQPSEIQIDQADIVTSIITVLFGAIHCFAWSFQFPSETERLLWRIASVVITACPIIWATLFTLLLIHHLGGNLSDELALTFVVLSAIAVPLYLVARAILLVLAVISLQSLPPAAYETVYWTTFIPHV